MKDFTDISDKLLDTDELIKHGSETFINNVGKIIAVIAALISIAATFTDISFTPIFSISFASSLLLILSMGYIIYFSLEEAGEVSGKNTEEYTKNNLSPNSNRTCYIICSHEKCTKHKTTAEEVCK